MCRICSLPSEIRKAIDDRIASGATLVDVVAFFKEEKLNAMNVSRHKRHSVVKISPSPSIPQPIDTSSVPDPELIALIYDQIKSLEAKKKQIGSLTPDESQLLLNWTRTLLDLKKAGLQDKRGETVLDYHAFVEEIQFQDPNNCLHADAVQIRNERKNAQPKV